MPYKLYIGPNTWMHPKNKIGLNMFIEKGFFEVVENINDANVIIYMSPSPNSDRINDIDILNSDYKNKLIILGPHFSVFPTEYLCSLKSVYSNIYLNLLSDWVCNYWKKSLNSNIDIYPLPYPVDIDTFSPNKESIKTNDIFIYYKNRNILELNIINDILKKYNYNITIINYKGYKEIDYINCLKKSIFGVWIGRHESQGFALEEALSTNIPLIVYNVKNMGQEEGYENNQLYCNTPASTIPYWDERCGEVFYNIEDFENMLLKLLINIEKYKPREFILENMEVNSLFNKKWKPLIEGFLNKDEGS